MQTCSNIGIEVRRSNRENILSLLSRTDGMSRADLCSATGLTGAGLSRIARELIDVGLVEETAIEARKGALGRRSTRLAINPNGAFVLGVTVTANRLSVALFNAAQTSLGETELAFVDGGDAEDTVSMLVDAARKLIETTAIARNRLVGIGVVTGVPSTDAVLADGMVTSRVLGWENVPLAALFEDAMTLPVKVEGRAAALLRAEISKTDTAHEQNLFLINCGAGIGTAGLFDGHLMGAGRNAFGRLSHVTCPKSKVLCGCGRTGCLEHAAAGASVVRELDERDYDVSRPLSELNPFLTDAIERANAGEKAARRAFRQAGENMAHGVDAVHALFDPDIIFLAGEVGRQSDYVGGVRNGLRKLATPIDDDCLQVSDVKSAEAAQALDWMRLCFRGV